MYPSIYHVGVVVLGGATHTLAGALRRHWVVVDICGHYGTCHAYVLYAPNMVYIRAAFVGGLTPISGTRHFCTRVRVCNFYSLIVISLRVM